MLLCEDMSEQMQITRRCDVRKHEERHAKILTVFLTNLIAILKCFYYYLFIIYLFTTRTSFING